MEQPFGHTLKFNLSSSRFWLGLGPGWAAIAGALAVGIPGFKVSVLLQLIGLWLLVNPILGTLWVLSVQQKLWQEVIRANLSPPSSRGFYLPYAQATSLGGRLILLLRCYRFWWGQQYWPVYRGEVITYGIGLILALTLGLAFNMTVFWLVILAISLTLLAGLRPYNLAARNGGRLQAVVQFLLPWFMGTLIMDNPLTPLVALIGLCYGSVYLGGLRMLGQHQGATLLFFGGQVTSIFLLLANRILPAAAILSVFLLAQLLLKTDFADAADLLQKVQVYLILGLLVTAVGVGL